MFMFQFIVLIALFAVPRLMTGNQSRPLHSCSDARIVGKCAGQERRQPGTSELVVDPVLHELADAEPLAFRFFS